MGLLSTALSAKGNSIGLRSLIYKYVLDISLPTLGNHIKAINGVPPRNRWSYKKDELYDKSLPLYVL
jgi:hypothetical protein